MAKRLERFGFLPSSGFLKGSVLFSPSRISFTFLSLHLRFLVSNQTLKSFSVLSTSKLIRSAHLSLSLFAPPTAGPKSLIADTERIEVSWCTKAGYGTRLIPEGTITSAQFLRTDTFVQIIGKGDMTKINVFPKDEGGELDPHGADGLGNPIGEYWDQMLRSQTEV